ncbi:MAG: tail fiber domain-containing protein [Mariprofundaceae bacterium]|nr:tail fiber domain-containing protein [Mariprofundaceae bacterium]
MAYFPAVQLSAPYKDYPNYFLKCYVQGTTTPLSMATDSTGGTLLVKAEISGGGIPPIGFLKTSGGAIFQPHLNATYDAWLFPTASEADVNDTSSAIQVADNVDLQLALVSVSKTFANVVDMVADGNLEVGEFIETAGYTTAGDGGNNLYLIVAAATGTDDGGSYIDLATHQAKGLFDGGLVNVRQFGADGTADDGPKFLAVETAGYDLVVPDGSYTITSNTTITKAVNFLPGSSTEVVSGVTLILDGPIVTPPGQSIITGAGTVSASFSGGLPGDPITNLFFGIFAGENNTPGTASEGTKNTGFGTQALRANTTGRDSVAMGYNALRSQTIGFQNTAVGVNSMPVLVGARENNAYGFNSMFAVTEASFNNGYGTNCMINLTTGNSNAGFGHNILNQITTETGNCAFGIQALNKNTAPSNSAFGNGTALNNTTGTGLSAFGNGTLGDNTTGVQNTAFGATALLLNTTGARNTAVGGQALDANITNNNSTAIGESALGASIADNNTCIGYNGLASTTTGTNVTGIGAGVLASSATASNEVTLGNSSVTTLRCQVALTVVSDARDKTDIEDLVPGLDFLMDLNPKTFRMNNRNRYDIVDTVTRQVTKGVNDGSNADELAIPGFIAQEVLVAVNKHSAQSACLVNDAVPERLEMTYGNLIPVLVKSMKQLNYSHQSALDRIAVLEGV